MTKNNGFLRFQGTPGYIASGPLVDAVNTAIALERPLLLKGEPGTGKTILARHVAEGLGMPMLSWHIKSTSKAADGLYVYDTVQRLNDSRFGGGNVADIRHYIKLGPLGHAFAAGERHVLLIDEIDKADLEFPNDLLRELDEMRFISSRSGKSMKWNTQRRKNASGSSFSLFDVMITTGRSFAMTSSPVSRILKRMRSSS